MGSVAEKTDEIVCDGDPGTGLSDLDRKFIASVIHLGSSRIGKTAPNPSVGALLVQFEADGARIVGRGVTGDRGRPHGEIIALQAAGDRAIGATCYVSLEPCAHHGRTPPCVTALQSAGVARVVMATVDADPRVRGKGARYLADNGVSVIKSATPEAADIANIGHLTRARVGRPAVTLKLALSKDGFIGRAGDGMSAITGPLSRRVVHALRARADVLMVGIGTILADNPDLTCRLPGMQDWSPVRVILDPNVKTPVEARLFDNIKSAPVRIFVGQDASEEKILKLEARGAEVLRTERDTNGLALEPIMMQLAESGTTNIFLEGGATLATSFLVADLVDRAMIFTGNGEIGADGISATDGGKTLFEHLRMNKLSCTDTEIYEDDELGIWERG